MSAQATKLPASEATVAASSSSRPVLFSQSLTLPADPPELQAQLLHAIAHTIIFQRALGLVRPRVVTVLENVFPAVQQDERVDGMVERGVQAALSEMTKRGGVQLVVSIFSSAAATLAPSQQPTAKEDLAASPSSGPTPPATLAERGTSRLKSIPKSWISQAVSLANQAYSHGYAFGGYGSTAADVMSYGDGGRLEGQPAEAPFEQWVISLRTVRFQTEHERSKAFLNASKQLAGFLNAIVDFVDQNKAHLPSIAEQDLLPFPIHITILPLP
ncbi:hypothetical protein V8E36_008107 [Tilletia maclaganii]